VQDRSAPPISGLVRELSRLSRIYIAAACICLQNPVKTATSGLLHDIAMQAEADAGWPDSRAPLPQRRTLSGCTETGPTVVGM